MKKTPLLMALMAISFFTFGQNMKIGVTGASVNSKFFGEEKEDVKFTSEFGYSFGATLEWKTNKGISVGVEPTFMDERGGITFRIAEEDTTYYRDSLDISIKYFSLPTYFLMTSKNKKWFASGGLDFIFPITAKELNGIDVNTDVLSAFNLGFLMGVGFQTPIRKWGDFRIEMRYSQSLQTLTDNEGGVLSALRSTRNLLKITYFLPISKR